MQNHDAAKRQHHSSAQEFEPAACALRKLAAAQRNHCRRDHQRVVGYVAKDVKTQIGIVRWQAQIVLGQHSGIYRRETGLYTTTR